jgi:TetR/AcrR family transcriptional regulator, transcriptional repressor of aconitase
MAGLRMDGEERRKAIVAAALPLFAKRGFVGTTTREIAAAAGVSEALVFRHFPTKAALYAEIVQGGCQADPGLTWLESLEPSTETLVLMAHFWLNYMVLAINGDREDVENRQRLMAYSYLEDGEFARLSLQTVFQEVFPKFEACIRAARDAGDLVEGQVPLENLFWFGHHVAAGIAWGRLSGSPAVPYRGAIETVIEDAVRFLLRALGVTEAAIAAHYRPQELAPSQPAAFLPVPVRAAE